MALKPWYRVVTPREDLREGKPLDASEFAVHLDQVRDGRAPADLSEARAVLRAHLPHAEPHGFAAEVDPPPVGREDRDLGRVQHGDASSAAARRTR